MITEEQVRNALEKVKDPHVPVPLSSMGMLRDIKVTGNLVSIEVCIPCMGCPGTSGLLQDIQECVMEIPGVAHVDVRLVEAQEDRVRFSEDLLFED